MKMTKGKQLQTCHIEEHRFHSIRRDEMNEINAAAKNRKEAELLQTSSSGVQEEGLKNLNSITFTKWKKKH